MLSQGGNKARVGVIPTFVTSRGANPSGADSHRRRGARSKERKGNSQIKRAPPLSHPWHQIPEVQRGETLIVRPGTPDKDCRHDRWCSVDGIDRRTTAGGGSMPHSSINRRNLLLASARGAVAAATPFSVAARASSAASPTADTIAESGFSNGYPTPEESVRLYDEMDYQRAVQAYIWATPLVNSVALKKALVDAGVSPVEPSLLVFDKHVGPKQIFMTANSEVIYAMGVFDLARTGPVVAEVPAGMPGGIWDFWERGVEDIGIGRSEHGGKFMILPPGSTEEVPPDFIPARSRTNNVFALARGILKPGESTEPFVKLASSIKFYTLKDKDRLTKVILNGGKPFDGDWPKDVRYFEYLVEGISDGTIEPQDKLMYAMLEPLGIAPGKPFSPNERQKKILDRAAEAGHRMVVNLAFANRFANSRVWQDRMWERSILTTTPNNETATRIELDERAQGWYQLVGNGVFPYSAKPVPGTGQWYGSAFHDNTGAYLHGGSTYRLQLDSDPPAERFWSVTIYDNRTRSMIDTDRQIAGLSSYSKLKKSADGSIDLYFGPHAPAGFESNWIETIPEEGFFAMFRLYNPLAPVFDGSWKLNDIVKVT
jgi:hypothetical protein